MSIFVCPLSQVEAAIARWRPSHVVSVLDPGSPFPELGDAYTDRHLRLSFHDAHAAGAGITLATAEHMASLLDFVRRWNAAGPLLVHCRAGIGRSTATAFAIACAQHPAVPELEIARALRRVAPF
ncbi:MAG: hypothetical protein H7066_01635, partial [Cytophagaceae bacterium]|nr:hypothetical protein [Gemmatimonadaceae bacterium]